MHVSVCMLCACVCLCTCVWLRVPARVHVSMCSYVSVCAHVCVYVCEETKMLWGWTPSYPPLKAWHSLITMAAWSTSGLQFTWLGHDIGLIRSGVLFKYPMLATNTCVVITGKHTLISTWSRSQHVIIPCRFQWHQVSWIHAMWTELHQLERNGM